MGTVVTVDVRDPSISDEAVAAVTRWLHAVDATFSTYRSDSAISRLDRGEISPYECPDTVAWILDLSAELADRTSGYFDVRYAGRLDPSGVVKGWSIDQADQILRTAGSTSHSINAGGDVRSFGSPEPARPWRVGIVDPHDRTRLTTSVAGTDFAVATSGTAERGAHVLDPHTPRPAEDLASVTVVGPDLTHADAYATAALAMGHTALDWLPTLDGFDAYVVLADGRTWWSDGFPAIGDVPPTQRAAG
ncbi:FAD:protein FMN transferase [Actinopolymorpha alba]|uniref:FAD:protein FMN transferase n=1 Tax=Actinopolymorpha alba TaxID=533267 RepID=UPI00036CAB80|nr:FAD:protein FMN transferase [Actinopolymorpha alba]